MDNGFNKFRKLFSPKDKLRFAIITLLMAISGIVESLGIGVLLAAVTVFLKPDGEFAGRANSWFAGFFPDAGANSFILCGAVTVAAILVLKNIFAFYIVHLQSSFIRKKQHELAARLFRAYLYADGKFFSSRPVEECNGNFQRILRLCDSYLIPAMQLLADILVIISLAVTVAVIMPVITLSGVAFILLAAWGISAVFRKFNLRLGEKLRVAEVAENKLRLEGLLGTFQIKCSGSEERFINDFANAQKEYASKLNSIYTIGQFPRFSLETIAVLMAVTLFIVLLLTGTSKADILLTFTVIVAALSRILPSLSRAHYSLTTMRHNEATFNMVFDEISNIPQEKHFPDGPVPDAKADIVIDNIDFAYDENKKIFSSFSLVIPARTTVGIAGKSGRGKTTLINLLMGLLQPDSGTISAGNTPIVSNISAWRRQIGYVPQNVFLFDTTLRENVAFGEAPEDIDDAKVIKALQLAQLDEFTSDLDRHFTGHGTTVSGGQRQRIGIARALYNQPSFLILDEATSALDSETESEVCSALAALHNQLTVIVISHRQSTLDKCDKIIRL